MDLFSTNILTRVVNNLFIPSGFLSSRYFGVEITEQSEEIHFDKAGRSRKLAPFVSPVVEGQIVEEQGYTTDTVKPAYIKPKTAFDPLRPLKRVIGEAIAGSLSPEQRMQALIAQELENHRQMIQRRLEWMASEILKAGAVTISGEKYPTVNVSFARDAALTVTLAGGALWSAAGTSFPLDDLQDWADLIVDKSGAAAIDVVMDIGAWKAFRKHATVQGRLDVRNARGGEIDLGALTEIGGSFKGTIDGFNIFVYQDRYQDDAGATQKFLANGTVIMTTPGEAGLDGARYFGAVLDSKAGYQALPFFSKSWEEEDPARRFIMTQSAPLLVPHRVNASLKASVL
jgi:hypothetical protein